ncbi:glycosyl hydrolase family 61-domain-containing protein [Pseudomassariella vexata]|uniref:lytic cellulose monooxygenase (C4-dehydrogenating) n=1 Tax=Pseudomassariella vexata TaxID=1141098 RepID=A0A1Y2DCM4_9PEZI|nr:glycosyl hydrolase family 61-domain-containing protein [Pseudomassariella vexata]ORY57008.1 glycosyl hydrolase family 61-domain-containing protein [Pseudomassariella vexata]
MRSTTSLMAVAAMLPFAFAHYNFEALIVNGEVTDAYEYVRQTNNSNSPVTDVTSTDMICNSGGLLSATMAKTKTYTVAPGDNVGFIVDASLSHPGPLSVWMSKAPDGTAANAYDGSGDWFKVYELTYSTINSEGIQWATYPSGTSGLSNFTIDLPSTLPAGDYLMRAEHVALHAASEVGGAQYYMGCAQLSVTGSGAGVPSPTTKIPGLYTGEEDGLVINIYYPIPTSYTAPGIATWPTDCVSHEANLEGQTFQGMCVGDDTASSDAASSGAVSSAAPTSTAAASAATSAATSAAPVAVTSAAAVVSAAPSSVVTSAETTATSAAAAATSSAASKCKKRKRSVV